ncbi:hypothetical protein NF27_DT00810 [Candidatus Jidaibacter acanthamoeba]|uniref:Uncharacterized protein n=1 Tax=Candidatus Jidaibacter acanthamoebae TaxID=86105 RepID=A0A0C1MT71_9RICK|nr:hypothetical protein NF27_DT00810 [Candidatus Jidaibacter acanthamoeba]
MSTYPFHRRFAFNRLIIYYCPYYSALVINFFIIYYCPLYRVRILNCLFVFNCPFYRSLSVNLRFIINCPNYRVISINSHLIIDCPTYRIFYSSRVCCYNQRNLVSNHPCYGILTFRSYPKLNPLFKLIFHYFLWISHIYSISYTVIARNIACRISIFISTAFHNSSRIDYFLILK